MARPVKQRKILAPHSDIWFFPAGNRNPDADSLLFLAEEFEAVKLIDYEGLNHSKAAKLMKVSRPTFTRIYKRARIKLSTSLVEKRTLKLSGENIYYGDNWHKCQNCECIYNVVKKSNPEFCPLCKSTNFINILNID
ncbi:MAG: DUF134 domain-containing protein [Candidatus Kapaibacterium sp.]